jgi:tetratricopeptide (TPR) repeat protein
MASVALAEGERQWVATVVSVEGSVEVRRSGSTVWDDLDIDECLYAGDILQVLENSRAALVLQNQAVVRLDAETTLMVHSPEKPSSLLVRILKGAAHFFSRIPHSLKVSTPFVNGAVEGTEFFVRVTETQAYFSVFRGRVQVSNDEGQLLLTDDTTATAGKDQAPTLKLVAHPRDAVNWALFYPSIGPLAGGADPTALSTAAYMLGVGRVDQAREILDRLIGAAPDNGNALALIAIIDLVQNRRPEARLKAEKAVADAPESSAAKMALAYVRQAFFDVEGARAILEAAVSRDPQNAFLWARLSELWLATGHRKKALTAAKKAGRLSPAVSRNQTVLGFAQISQVKIDAARKAFHKAIQLDPADPLPRLGLGLAMIRDGDLPEGREQIEIAAALDPGNALVRSYLGKAFYEGQLDALASRQYEIAKVLDPNDPTPYLYSAIQKQSQNRPVEALYDLERSIALNDNRAVYRSRLLLDDDLAARSVSLAGIYSDLGFQRAALMEGWKSVTADPTNHSAHLLLSGAYSVLPRHEIARVSELLQSQLLQPINITPIQPLASEGHFSVLERAGYSEVSYNEYNALFNRDRFTLRAEGLLGEYETYGNHLTHSAVIGRWSYSIGQSHFQTDGFRANNDLTQNHYTAFSQVSLSPATSLQAEYRHKNFERGDLNIRFDPDVFAEELREEERSNYFRFGFRHALTPSAVLLTSISHNSAEFEQPDITTIDEKGYGGETQILYNSPRIDLITGFGYFRIDAEEKEIYLGDPDDPDDPDEITTWESDSDHTNYYTYLLIHPLDNISLTLGGSRDDFSSDDFDLNEDQFNPKLGLTWEVVSGTLLRGAAFRTFERTLLFNQTLEPTHVAGFNQFYVDGEGSDTWLYGVGIDQRFSPLLNLGAEYVRRDISVVGEIFGPRGPEIAEADWEEEISRLYVYSAPFSMVSLGVGYNNERLKRPQAFQGEKGITELTTHRFFITANFFHSSGLSLEIKPTYIEQYGKFGSTGPPFDTVEDDDQFCVVDASASWRLPRKLVSISIETKNIFNHTYRFQDSDLYNRTIAPERFVLGRIILSF